MKLQKAKLPLERFTMNMPDIDISNVENLARKNGVSMSWVYRSILKALDKKYSGRFSDERDEIKRPKKFATSFRQTVVCFYGDKSKWMSLSRIWKLELGPLIRFGLGLYYEGKLDLDLENSNTVKEIKFSVIGKKIRKKSRRSKNRYTYHYQNSSNCYSVEDFWEKNVKGNIFLMERGLSNRKTPLIL